ncbi:MAG: GNAT family N-acetyltransferase [Lachnospiraceae bacterium]|nr:GNAT family N-acetyltransferase [Lachnospiraceae bacterium]
MYKTGTWNMDKKDRLRKVVFDLGDEWKEEAENLRERLRQEGIVCSILTDAGSAVLQKRETVVLTDSAATGKWLSQEGIVYFGCQRRERAWLDGAALVLEGFEEIDAGYLEEWMCRAQGRPAKIAGTKRLLLREIDEKDLSELVRIGKEENGLALLNEDAFTSERLRSYFMTAYRLQGYGLWSVLHGGKVIGCCGFAPYEENDNSKWGINEKEKLRGQIWTYRMCHDADTADMNGNVGETDDRILELQYMLDMAYRRQGFGTEMCRAALQYAQERLDVNEIRLRIRPDNGASQALARKLGFKKIAEN